MDFLLQLPSDSKVQHAMLSFIALQQIQMGFPSQLDDMSLVQQLVTHLKSMVEDLKSFEVSLDLY